MSIQEKIEFKVTDYGARPDGEFLCTAAIQKAIDAAAEVQGKVTFTRGIYLTGAVFVKSNVELEIGEGVELRGVVDESAYPEIWSRVAGIEMVWPSGLINVYAQENVKISGKGLINGQGEYWWHKYWGTDRMGGIRKIYTEKGLRGVVDYDCKRPRNILVYNSSQVVLQGLSLIRSPFWNVHICYSKDVHVDGLDIRDNQGPSTDGIDVDSSTDVLVENCYIECNDDNLCIKSGRDADGLRVNRPAENIVIRNCETGAGGGITLGSETSGGMRNIEIHHIVARGTNCGVRFKSARVRGGLIENIRIHDLELIDVPNPFSFQLNWNPSYSNAVIPEGWQEEIPVHWKTLAQPIEPPEKGIPEFRNVDISNITVRSVLPPSTKDYHGRPMLSKAFDVEAYPEKPIKNIRWSNINVETNTSGSIAHAENWTMENVTIRTQDGEPVQLENCVNVEVPKVERL